VSKEKTEENELREFSRHTDETEGKLSIIGRAVKMKEPLFVSLWEP
jgi:hypothetical protein